MAVAGGNILAEGLAGSSDGRELARLWKRPMSFPGTPMQELPHAGCISSLIPPLYYVCIMGVGNETRCQVASAGTGVRGPVRVGYVKDFDLKSSKSGKWCG